MKEKIKKRIIVRTTNNETVYLPPPFNEKGESNHVHFYIVEHGGPNNYVIRMVQWDDSGSENRFLASITDDPDRKVYKRFIKMYGDCYRLRIVRCDIAMQWSEEEW